MPRKLIHVPIVHDFFIEGGNFADRQFLCRQSVLSYLSEMESFWDDLEKKLEDRTINKIYQDSYCGKEEEYQWHVTNRYLSRNSDLILKLEEKGAELIPTELSLALSLFNYVYKCKINNDLHGVIDDYKKEAMEARNAWIAVCIKDTLLPGETGILFLGSDHDIVMYLESLCKGVRIESFEKPSVLIDLSMKVYSEYKKKYEKNNPISKRKIYKTPC